MNIECDEGEEKRGRKRRELEKQPGRESGVSYKCTSLDFISPLKML